MSQSADPQFGTTQEMLDAARDFFASEDYEDALAALRAGRPEWREERAAASLARDCFMRMGEISKALGEINRIRRSHDEDTLRHQARFMLGRLRETDPNWLPVVPDVSASNVSPGVVLHVLKESLPYSETGFTFRSRMTLAAHARAGWKPVVVTSLGFPRTKAVDRFPMVEVIDGVDHHRLDLGPEIDIKTMPYDILLSEQARMTGTIAARIGPALVQAGTGFRGYDTALVGMAVARKAGVPFVYEVRGFQEQTWTSDIYRSERGEYYRRRMAQELRCLSSADRVITIAEAMRDEIINRGIDAELVHVVPNAVDVERFTPRPKRADLLESLGLVDHQVIGYISNLGWREGMEYLVEATGHLVRSGEPVKCLIVGDGPERERLHALVREQGIEDFVVLTGHVPNHEIEDHYALIDLFVVPRVNDRASRLVTPLKPLEAMAMGIPVVVSDLPALRELAKPGERGMVFEPANAADLAAVARELLRDDATRNSYAEGGRRWVLEQRTLESNVARYQKALGPLL